MRMHFELAWSLSPYLRCVTCLYSVPASGVDVAGCIDLNAVGNASVDICEYSAIFECASLRVNIDRIAVVQGSARRSERTVVAL